MDRSSEHSRESLSLPECVAEILMVAVLALYLSNGAVAMSWSCRR